MSSQKNSTLFLERASYRQRRMRDAARMLPLLGIVLWAIPLLWTERNGEPTSNADAMLYIFGVWVVLIIISALITRALRDKPDAD